VFPEEELDSSKGSPNNIQRNPWPMASLSESDSEEEDIAWRKSKEIPIVRIPIATE
jgi:hypothetical protein